MVIRHGGNLFAIARERGWDWRDLLEFSASINPLGPAPGVRDAIVAALDRIVHYPEKSPQLLAERLSELWGVDAAQILLGNGATELLHFLARQLDWAGVTLVVPTFSEFHRAWPNAALIAPDEAAGTRAPLVLTQPNNPVGSALPCEQIAGLVAARRTPVLVDESFIEFTGLPSIAQLTRHYDKLFVLRSLTKFYALPGLRIGALVGPAAIVEKMKGYREPWQVNVLAEAAALAAIADRGHAARSIEFVRTERAWVESQLSGIRALRLAASCANYLTAWVNTDAEALCAWFLDRKILLRDLRGTPGISGEAIRFAIRTRPENERLVAGLKEYFCEP